jgi:hypothetical protein
MSNWKTVYKSETEHRARIVNDVLEKAGIHSVIVNKRDSSYNNFGNFEVAVDPDNILEALKIISDEITFE